MAININTTVETYNGFQVDSAWAFIHIDLRKQGFCTLKFYRSKDSFNNGDRPLNLNLPSRVKTQLTNEQFWSSDAIETLHNRCIAKIESVTGAGTCTIDKSE